MAKIKGLSITGDKEIDAAMDSLSGKEAVKAMKNAMKPVAEKLLGEVKSSVAIDTGALRDNLFIQASKRFNFSQSTEGKMSVSVNAPYRKDLGIPDDAKGYYPAAVEYGTKTMQAQPFMRTGWDRLGDEALYNAIKDQFLEQVEAIWLGKKKKLELKKIKGQRARSRRVKKIRRKIKKIAKAFRRKRIDRRRVIRKRKKAAKEAIKAKLGRKRGRPKGSKGKRK